MNVVTAQNFLDLTAASPNLRLLLDYWMRQKSGEAEIPIKTDIDALEIFRMGLAPWVWLMEKVDTDDFRFRLVGCEVRQNFSIDPVSRRLSETMSASSAHQISNLIREIIENQFAHFSEGPVRAASEGRYYYGRRILLPLGDGSSPRYVIGVFEKHDMKPLTKTPEKPVYDYDIVAWTPATDLQKSDCPNRRTRTLAASDQIGAG